MSKHNVKSDLSLREKSDYVTNLINTKKGLDNDDTLAYKYIYDITKYLVYRKFKTITCSSDIPKDVVQTVVFNTFHNISKEYKRKEDLKIDSIFSYLARVLVGEVSKLNRSQYKGKIHDNLVHTSDLNDEFDMITHPVFEIEAYLNILKNLKIIIDDTYYNLNVYPLVVEHRFLLFFPLLLSIAREDKRLINQFKKRIRVALKDIYQKVGTPSEKMK
ncbi:MAG: hypothetical protein HKO92_02210 [Flavobacteriaceae bacterium]|nr:hypothetical protein [Flavobacteriaceae bacterium]